METHNLSETDRKLIEALTASNNRLAAALESQRGERLLTCSDVAKIVGKSPKTISRYLAQGRIKKGVRDGRVGIPESELRKIQTP